MSEITNFAAFFSYVRADDEHDNGRLTRLRQMIEDEVQAVTGETFEIFQDDQDIHLGQKWQERLEATLDGTTFLIIAVTPRYLKRPACREELERFIERERKLGRNDLILPILYIVAPGLSDQVLLDADHLAQAIASRQYFDWRDLRHEPHTNPDVGKRLEKMAREIEKAMRRSAPPAPKPAPKIATTSPAAPDPVARESEPPNTKISPRNEPTELVVDPMPRRGDYTKIMDAIKAAEPGNRILIRPGLYKEALVLEKALELLGDGERNEIIVETFGANILLFKTEFGRVANLTLRQTGGGDFFGVDIVQGGLELEDCDISSQALSCVGIHNGADPRLRRNRIHYGKASGVLVYENGRGTLEDNDIFGNTLAGVSIEIGGDPTLRHNRIYDGKQVGVGISKNGKGILDDNDIFGNTVGGIGIKTGGNPYLRRNRIHDERYGVFIYEDGKGILEDNDIFANTRSGLDVREGGIPIVRSNRITKNEQAGISIRKSGGGTFVNNDLRENRQPWKIDESSQANVKKSGNIEK